MKHLVSILCFCLLFSLIGCSPISVRSDYDEEVDFSHYQTFKWMPHPKKSKKTVRKNSGLDRKIKNAVEEALLAKGYEIIDSGEADALLAYHVGIERHIRAPGVGYGYYGHRGRRFYPYGYKEGSLIIDVIDPELDQLVWRGAGTGSVGHPDGSVEKINEAVTKILEKFPPEQK